MEYLRRVGLDVMTPEDFQEFQRQIVALQQTLGYDLENRIDGVERIRHTFAENAVELEGSLLAFQDPKMHGLMNQSNGDKLDLFLMLVTRRLYNHLATSVSVVEHLREVLRGMPSALADCRESSLALVREFETGHSYQVHLRLRDHSVHRQLHLTEAQVHLGKPKVASAPDNAWEISTRIRLSLVSVRSSRGGS